MSIYRPVNGIYRCISNPTDTRRYVFVEKEGSYPMLVPIEKEFAGDETGNQPDRKDIQVKIFPQ